MPELKKRTWEVFSRGIAGGIPRPDAYREAFPTCKNPSKAAYKLWQKQEIQERVRELIPITQTAKAITAVVNKEFVIAELLRLGKAAEDLEKPDLATARLCIKDVGEIIGAFDKTGRVKFDWDGDPANLSDSQLEKLKFFLERLAVGEKEARQLQMKRLQSAVVDISHVTLDVSPNEEVAW